MSRRPRRNHTPVFKSNVALAAVKGDKTVAELAQQFDVHADRKPVFVKDMCYYVADYVEGDHNFVRRVKNTFLIRTSEQSIP